MEHMTETETEFIKKEIATWTEDYVYDLLDRGYKPILLVDHNGVYKWSWILTSALVVETT